MFEESVAQGVTGEENNARHGEARGGYVRKFDGEFVNLQVIDAAALTQITETEDDAGHKYQEQGKLSAFVDLRLDDVLLAPVAKQVTRHREEQHLQSASEKAVP